MLNVPSLIFIEMERKLVKDMLLVLLLRYFRLVNQRVHWLYERVLTLVEFTTQLRDLNQTKTDEKQNKNLAFLTVISSIFMPLTLIVGWYGMNFKYMPELEYEWAYPALVGVCVIIVTACIVIFKKRKML
jgi:magnesium transporter